MINDRTCPVCNEEFESSNSRGAHFWQGHDDDEKKESLLEILVSIYEESGEVPTCRQTMNLTGFGHGTYSNYFGSWNEAIEKSGLDVKNRKNIPDEELIDEIRRLRRLIGRPPCGHEMNKLGKFSANIYQRRFGSWNDSLKEAGLDINKRRRIPRQDLIDELHRLEERIGKSPTSQDMDKKGKYGWTTYISRFGSWNEALEEAGLSLNQEKGTLDRKSDVKYFGDNWDNRREDILKRDSFRCRICGRNPGKLSVHHIDPRRNYSKEQSDEMNRKENLITLCRRCHIKFEGMFKDFDDYEFEVAVRNIYPSREADKYLVVEGNRVSLDEIVNQIKQSKQR